VPGRFATKNLLRAKYPYRVSRSEVRARSEWNVWYEWAVSLADDLYDGLLAELRHEGFDLMARTKLSDLRKQVEARLSARHRLAAKLTETLEEIRLYEYLHAEGLSEAELAGRLGVTQGAISKLEHADDGVDPARSFNALGARLELVAVFDPSPPRR
jgi:hypothetical protein